MYDKIGCLYVVILCEILRFWKFSRNRLAGDESPPGDTSFLTGFVVLGKGPPGGTFPAARRCIEKSLKWLGLDAVPGGG